jgi:uncharacterized protein (DUF697 family)
MTKNNISGNQGLMEKILDWAYSKAIMGFGNVDSAYTLGDEYLRKKGYLRQQVDALIRWQVSKAAVSGFITGIGGFAAFPISFPANVASVVYIQIRMISAIAYMGGYDLKDDKVKMMVLASMVGNGAKDLLKDMGISLGEKWVGKIIMDGSSSKIVSTINKKLGTKFFTKAGSKNLGKLVPLMGGVIGGAFDAAGTRIVGITARKIFIDGAGNALLIRRN